MNFRLYRLGIFVLLAVIMSGCGKPALSSSDASSDADKLFASSPWSEDWSTANAAIKTNGYVLASVTLNKLRAQQLSAEQRKAVTDALISLNGKMAEAASKGDAAAQQALQEIQNAAR